MKPVVPVYAVFVFKASDGSKAMWMSLFFC